ncbi:MAG: hypothetical protein ACQETL_05895 [Bacteroidota bacterium]
MNRLIIYCLVFIATISACQQDKSFEESNQKDITIEEVQTVFKEKQSKNIHSRTNNNPMDIIWDRAVYKELNIGDGLFFPVNTNTNGEGKLFMSMPDSDKKFLADYASYSMAYKDEDGEVVLEHIIPVSTADTEKFTGFLLVSEWQGDAKRKVYYENGEIIDVAALSKQYIDKEDIDGQRMSTCYIVDDWWCVTATTSAGNSYTTCTYEGSYIYCEEPQEIAPPSPDPDSGGGGGSTGPSGPDGLCEHPFIDGMYVDCNEVICSEGYIVNENDECVIDCGDDMIPDGEGGCKTPGFKICNRYIPFDEIPNDDEESSFTGEVLNVNVPAIHSETGDQVSAYWGAWCVTFGSSALNVNSSTQASNIFKQAWEISTQEAEIWLNLQNTKPTDIEFSNYFKSIFESNLANLANGTVFLTTGGGCISTSSTWLIYCN